MNWYKVFHGLPYDPQLAVVSRRAGVNRAEVLAVMIALMDHASRNNPRGSLDGLDAEQLAVALDIEAEHIESALQALRDKELICAGNRLSGWQAQNTSTDRVREHRARRGIAKRSRQRPPVSEADTPAAVAARHARLRENDSARKNL